VKALEKCMGDPVALRKCMCRVVPTYIYKYREIAAAEGK
jgi:hypothetical protein